MAVIILSVVGALLLVLVLVFHGALVFAYRRGGVGGMLRMLGALVFHEIMITFFH